MRPERSAAFDHGAQLCQLTEPGPSCPAPRLEGADPGKEGAAGTRCASVGRVRLRGTRRPVLWGGYCQLKRCREKRQMQGHRAFVEIAAPKQKETPTTLGIPRQSPIQVLTEPDPA